MLFPISAIPSLPNHPLPPAKASSKIASKASAATTLPAKRKDKDPVDLTSSGSDSDSDSETGDDDEQGTLSGKKTSDKKKQMPRISKEERECVCDWIRKLRKDGKMFNGRWIQNGGAKGATMTATSSEVKTSGAYEALAMCERARAPTLFFWFVNVTCLRRYVNRRLRVTFVWTKEVAKKRWVALCVFSVVFNFDSNDL
jgi:hypothetical protein